MRLQTTCMKCNSLVPQCSWGGPYCHCGNKEVFVSVDISPITREELEFYMRWAPMPWPLDRRFIPDVPGK